MAYLHALREFTARLLGQLPASCGLCLGSARGGRLCGYCHLAVTRSMVQSAPRCPVCQLVLNGAGMCPDCVQHTPAFDRVIAAFDYAPPGDLLIHRLKIQRQFISAGMLAGLLADAVLASTPALHAAAVLVPVPASRAALLRRGFNPAAELARSLARKLRRPCRPELLLRAREGVKQAQLSRVERARSVQALYSCPPHVHGLHIAVVDDVLTTGSTLHSIARTFKAGGAASVWGLVLARTPYPADGLVAAPGPGPRD